MTGHQTFRIASTPKRKTSGQPMAAQVMKIGRLMATVFLPVLITDVRQRGVRLCCVGRSPIRHVAFSSPEFPARADDRNIRSIRVCRWLGAAG
jgi:hypothetical protein